MRLVNSDEEESFFGQAHLRDERRCLEPATRWSKNSGLDHLLVIRVHCRAEVEGRCTAEEGSSPKNDGHESDRGA